ncbi:flagellar brake protein [Thermotoga sp. KOL6]|uniref:flagellar brake protein n=1 Tax=Thermotoga sp. KOL6 TaxID=126741 RepID=UPI000C785F55|nr:flagellar brake domain-containing protein [Thermotoga sp. KOL6]PLV58383.1 pilus assembly protein PilZ [Thermotoga sp. KOL6]
MQYYTELVKANDVIRPGQNVSVEVTSPEDLEGEYKSSVHDVDFERGILILSMPSFKGRLVPLPRGTRCVVKIIDSSAIYMFRTSVLESGRDEDGFPVTKVLFPNKLRKVQRRRYKRIKISLEGTYRVSSKDEPPKRFVTRDFSAGGMLMVVNDILTPGQIIYVTIDLDTDLKLVDHPARIVRDAGMLETGERMYGVEFLNVPPSLEKKLVTFVFRKEIEMRNKERGETE